MRGARRNKAHPSEDAGSRRMRSKPSRKAVLSAPRSGAGGAWRVSTRRRSSVYRPTAGSWGACRTTGRGVGRCARRRRRRPPALWAPATDASCVSGHSIGSKSSAGTGSSGTCARPRAWVEAWWRCRSSSKQSASPP